MNSLILVNKPMNMTSFDVVAIARKAFGIKRIGHAGTLDPNATGLLIILLDKATKRLNYLDTESKTYRAVLRLGLHTDTADIWGEVLQTEEVPYFDIKQIETALNLFIGDSEQIPPMVSAISVKGKRLYQYARENIEVERKPRKITISSIKLLAYDAEQSAIEFEVCCSAGTYVRTLCEDIAKRLGTIGTMASLERTAIGPYRLEDAISIDALRNGLMREQKLHYRYPLVDCDDAELIRNGKRLMLKYQGDCIIVRCGNLEAAYEWDADSENYHCLRGLW